MVILWTVEELSEGVVILVIILGVLNVEVVDPAELTINVSLFGQLCVVRHSRSLDFVLLIWI